MGFLEEVLRYSDQHAKGVVLALLALLMAGAAGGGLYIANLQTSLAERDKLFEQRVQLVQQRLANELRVLEQANVALRAELQVSYEAADVTGASLQDVLQILALVRKTGTLDASRLRDLEAIAGNLDARVRELAETRRRSQDISRLVDAIRKPGAGLPAAYYMIVPSWMILLLLAGALGFGGVVFLLIRRLNRSVQREILGELRRCENADLRLADLAERLGLSASRVVREAERLRAEGNLEASEAPITTATIVRARRRG